MKSIVFVLVILFSIGFFFNESYAFENGLIEGQWVKYKISELNIAAENATLVTFLQSQSEGLTNISLGDQQISSESIDWFKIQIDTVEDRSFTGKIIIMTTDGQEIPAGTFSKSINEFIDIIDYAIPIDTEVGSTFYSGITKKSGVQTNNILTETIGTQIRDVYDLRYLTYLTLGDEDLETKYQHLFDKQTGIFLATNIHAEINTNEFGFGQVDLSIHAVEMFVPEKQFVPNIPEPSIENSTEGGGCLIATATFGSELAPQVQQLRELRDNTILTTKSGLAFMSGFNQFYYSFSPAIADLERENTFFRESIKLGITPLLASLSILNFVEIDSEAEMLGYGIGIILMNVGMYFVVPATLIWKFKRNYS